MNPSDITYALITETTAGTTPATPAWVNFPYIPGSMPSFAASTVTSSVLQASRASLGARKVDYKVGGSLKTQFCRGNHMDPLLASAFSGSWATSTLKASNVDTNISIEKRMSESGTPYFHRFKGVQVSDFTLTCDATTAAEATFTLIGLNRVTDTAIVTGATYTNPAASTQLTGLDVTGFTVAGLTATFRSLQLQVSHNREAQDQFGQAAARAVGTSGFRSVKLKAQLYRTDLSADTLLALSDTPIAVSFTIGGTGQGYVVTLPAANFDVPQDVEQNSKALVEVNFTAAFDNTSATDISIVKN